MILAYYLIGSLLSLFIQSFLCVHHACLKYLDSDESDDSDEEEFDELGSESGSFGMCGTCLDRLLCHIENSKVVMTVGGDWPFNGGGGTFGLEFGMCTVDDVCTNDKLLCARGVVIKTVLCIARRSEVSLNYVTDVSQEIICCKERRLDVSR